MKIRKIGIIKEEKVPIDRRVVLSPEQAVLLQERYASSKVVVQPSTVRCFKEEDYHRQGIEINQDLEDADVLLGVKEVPVSSLIPNKTYFFFSHTIKKQPYNRELLRAIVEKGIRLIDYECLTDSKGQRLIAFGRWAGIVGAYNALWTYGQSTGAYHIRRAWECFDYEDLKREYPKIQLPALKVVVTGGGRVAKGACEVLDAVGIQKVEPSAFLKQSFHGPVYTRLDMKDYHIPKEDKAFDTREFYQHPDQFESSFFPFTTEADLLIAAAYWDPAAPVLFTRKDMLKKEFKVKIIADITCDIEGSIPSTLRPSEIDHPVYDYDPVTGREAAPFSSPSHIHVMAIDNLPCELPRDSSKDFGDMFLSHILPALMGDDPQGIIERATIARDGQLTPRYQYLQAYMEGKE
jgi:alanine dehydrogenase